MLQAQHLFNTSISNSGKSVRERVLGETSDRKLLLMLNTTSQTRIEIISPNGSSFTAVSIGKYLDLINADLSPDNELIHICHKTPSSSGIGFNFHSVIYDIHSTAVSKEFVASTPIDGFFLQQEQQFMHQNAQQINPQANSQRAKQSRIYQMIHIIQGRLTHLQVKLQKTRIDIEKLRIGIHIPNLFAYQFIKYPNQILSTIFESNKQYYFADFQFNQEKGTFDRQTSRPPVPIPCDSSSVLPIELAISPACREHHPFYGITNNRVFFAHYHSKTCVIQQLFKAIDKPLSFQISVFPKIFNQIITIDKADSDRSDYPLCFAQFQAIVIVFVPNQFLCVVDIAHSPPYITILGKKFAQMPISPLAASLPLNNHIIDLQSGKIFKISIDIQMSPQEFLQSSHIQPLAWFVLAEFAARLSKPKQLASTLHFLSEMGNIGRTCEVIAHIFTLAGSEMQEKHMGRSRSDNTMNKYPSLNFAQRNFVRSKDHSDYLLSQKPHFYSSLLIASSPIALKRDFILNQHFDIQDIPSPFNPNINHNNQDIKNTHELSNDNSNINNNNGNNNNSNDKISNDKNSNDNISHDNIRNDSINDNSNNNDDNNNINNANFNENFDLNKNKSNSNNPTFNINNDSTNSHNQNSIHTDIDNLTNDTIKSNSKNSKNHIIDNNNENTNLPTTAKNGAYHTTVNESYNEPINNQSDEYFKEHFYQLGKNSRHKNSKKLKTQKSSSDISLQVMGCNPQDKETLLSSVNGPSDSQSSFDLHIKNKREKALNKIHISKETKAILLEMDKEFPSASGLSIFKHYKKLVFELRIRRKDGSTRSEEEASKKALEKLKEQNKFVLELRKGLDKWIDKYDSELFWQFAISFSIQSECFLGNFPNVPCLREEVMGMASDICPDSMEAQLTASRVFGAPVCDDDEQYSFWAEKVIEPMHLKKSESRSSRKNDPNSSIIGDSTSSSESSSF